MQKPLRKLDSGEIFWVSVKIIIKEIIARQIIAVIDEMQKKTTKKLSV
ncbi:hypothetical protein FEDK69T_09740 [Flavobacterium enshiense DK69]|nr:hypothetical protein [Flavobacterium enshiense]ESU24525.1 hypothetical protein FEDK69T_09740 [Flavobacterium enshiense DK69]